MKNQRLFFATIIGAALYLFSFTPLQAKEPFLLFWGRGCPHCARVEHFLQKNHLGQILAISRREIYFNQQNRAAFLAFCRQHGIPPGQQGVPLAYFQSQYYLGDEAIIKALKKYLQTKGQPLASPLPKQAKPGANNNKGQLNWFTVASAALVDAFNPCAFAVLILLLGAVLAAGQSRRRAFLAGLSFTAAIFLSYLAMGLGLYRALASANLSRHFVLGISFLALLLALLNIKDYFFYGRGLLMEVPLSWRPRLRALLGKITSPGGAFLAGFNVSLFLLPCTSGPYLIILGLLAKNGYRLRAISWLLFYNLIFISPMLLLNLAVARGLAPGQAEDWRRRHLRQLHLGGGLLMLVLGLYLLRTFF